MLTELRVRDLGVIDDVTLVLGPGVTALTGETGAGKTLVVEAIGLLLGGRGDPILVRPGAHEAKVEGRFSAAGSEGDDLILARAVPALGRARAYVDSHMASVATLAEAGGRLVDLHGQHAHQSLLAPGVQRAALDEAGGIDTEPILEARRRLRSLGEARRTLGGDAMSRARELDLVIFQLEELDAAGLSDPDEDTKLEEQQDRLRDASGLREAAQRVSEELSGDDGVIDRLSDAVNLLAGRRPLTAPHERLGALVAELIDAARDLRASSESFEDDPARLNELSERRHRLGELRRKYGESIAEVIAYRERMRLRAVELSSWEERATALDAETDQARAELSAAEGRVGELRRRAAPELAGAVESELRRLALPRARFDVVVGDEPSGDSVTWMFAANPGEPTLPLSKIASGGELARTMLAVRLVLSGVAGPTPSGESRTLVFDEVDAGIGGETAVAVGEALASLGRDHQVLVVTHLAQVAAFAEHHVAVTKETVGDRVVSRVRSLADGERVVEISRMLSGQPGSETARRHAEELLREARASAGRLVT